MAKARSRKLGYRWHLRRLMAEHDMFATTDLVPLLAERGVALSAAQVYRLVTGTPERLSLRTLVALCDILGCTPTDMIEPVTEPAPLRATGTSTGPGGKSVPPGVKARTPRRAEITPRR
jgi:DNA-binding Xre family transcriptional regulator